MRRNELKYFFHSFLYSLTPLMITGSILQAFLLENGMAQDAVAQLMALFQAIQVGAMLLFSLLIDRLKNILKFAAAAYMGQLLLLLVLGALCLLPPLGSALLYLIVLIAGILTNIIIAVSSVLGYKIPYLVIDMRNFGTICGNLGFVGGILGILVSLIMTFLTARFNYNFVMFFFFCIAAIALLLSGILLWRIRPLAAPAPPKKKKRINMLRYKPFTHLFFPNLLRGFTSGVLGVAMTIGFSLGITDHSSGAMLSLMLQLANVACCFIYARIARERNDHWIILCATFALAIALPLMLLWRAPIVFYIFYLLANFSIGFINNAVPVAVTKIIDFDCAGQYSSWRMTLHTLGMTLGNAAALPLIGLFGSFGTMLLAATAQLLSGGIYFLFLRRFWKNAPQ